MAVNLFDANFYRAVNPDLASFNDAQAFQHLINSGLNEGRTFSQYVDLNVYRANNPDLAAAGLTTNQQLYNHLSTNGAAERRTFSSVFNANVYRELNADLQAAGLNNEQLFDHFRSNGINEGRQASESFSVSFYLAANPDLQAAGFNNQQALQHYIFFDPNSNKFFAVSEELGTEVLFSIGLDGTTTRIGGIGFSGVFGLDFDNGTLFGYTSDQQQITINTVTGAGTFSQDVTGVNGVIWGAA